MPLTRAEITKRGGSVAPLAHRMLKSVFTIEAGSKLGTGFLAWTSGEQSYLLTANHVVDGAGHSLTITRKGASWSAEVIGRDAKNDLALLRADGRPAHAAPLWQHAHLTGIVSRVDAHWIQTRRSLEPRHFRRSGDRPRRPRRRDPAARRSREPQLGRPDPARVRAFAPLLDAVGSNS